MPKFTPLAVSLEVCDLHVVHLLHLLANHPEAHRFRIVLHDSGLPISRENHAALDCHPDLIGLPQSAVLVCRMNNRFPLDWRHRPHPWCSIDETDILLTVQPGSQPRVAQIESVHPDLWIHVDTETGEAHRLSRIKGLPSVDMPPPDNPNTYHSALLAVQMLHDLPRTLHDRR